LRGTLFVTLGQLQRQIRQQVSAFQLLYVSQELTHRRAKGGGELVHYRDGRHPLASFEETYVIAVQAGFGSERFLREASSKSSLPKHFAEAFLESMHGSITRGEKSQCTRMLLSNLPIIVLHTIVCILT